MLDKYFWNQVKYEFLFSNSMFLCNGSATFKTAWENSKLKNSIQELSKKFIEEKKYNFEYGESKNLLFKNYKYSNSRIRLEFINWVIENKLYEN